MTNKSNSALQFDTIVNTYCEDLYRYAIWLTKEPANAEELVQQTFLRASKSLGSLTDSSIIKVWLLTILRKENARRFNTKQSNSSLKTNKFINDIQQSQNRANNLAASNIRTAITKMDDEYAEPLVLHTLFGYNCKEIANILEIKEDVVTTHLLPAKNKLQSLLDEKSNASNKREFNLTMVV